MEANSVMGKHEFVITVSNILPEFKSLPDWQKEAAYSQFSRDIEETTWDNDHLDPAELGQVMFSSGQLDKYLRVAVKAGGIMELLKTYADRLGDYQNLSQLIRSELQMFEKINPNVGVNGEMQYQYSLDLSGQYPILDAVFDADYNTAALSIYDNPIDLKTGQVLPKVQATQREESSASEKEAQPKNKYEISCRPVSFPDSNIRAFVDVTVNDAVQIHGIRIIEGSKGLFVSLPSRPHKNAEGKIEYKDIVVPRTAEARETLHSAILDTYYPEGGSTSQTVGRIPDQLAVQTRITPYTDERKPNLRGLGSVTVGDFVITGIQLLAGEKGMFLNMPFKTVADAKTGEVDYSKIVTMTPQYMKKSRETMVMEYKHQTEKKTDMNRTTDLSNVDKAAAAKSGEPPRMADQFKAAQAVEKQQEDKALAQER